MGTLILPSREVSGKTIGIIGLAKLEVVAKRARAFDMDVLYTGPHRKEEKERDIGAKYVDLDTLLKMQILLQSMRHIIHHCII